MQQDDLAACKRRQGRREQRGGSTRDFRFFGHGSWAPGTVFLTDLKLSLPIARK